MKGRGAETGSGLLRYSVGSWLNKSWTVAKVRGASKNDSPWLLPGLLMDAPLEDFFIYYLEE